ncbi:MAG: restriction endonuclease subunit S [Chromatiaceae bacterium]
MKADSAAPSSLILNPSSFSPHPSSFNLHTFFEKFDLFADAPDAVAKMRQLVLDLAATGRLLPRKGEWETRSLKSLATKIGSGATPAGGRESYFSEGIPLIRLMNVHFRGFDRTGLVFLSNEQADQLSNVTVQANDVLLNITGASIGRVTIAPTEMAGARVNQHVTIIRPTPELFPRFLSLLLASPSVQRMIDEIQVGATRQALTKGMIEQFDIPLPPLAEQKRIVAKVDELMALCDRLEAQQQERETRYAALVRASLARFVDAPTPANLPFLFHPSYAIPPADLRKSILTLAVQGKLVPQDPNDEPADDLLANINRERLAAVKAGRISPMKPLPPVEEGESAYDLRPGRALARLIEVVMEIQTGPFGSSLHQSDYQVGGTPVINPASLRDGRIVPIESMAIGPDTLNRLEVFCLKEGDIVMARRGEMGRCAIVTKAEHGWLCGTGSLVLRMPTGMYAPFLALLIGAPEAREYLGGASVGTTMQNLNQGILAKMPVGVPPLAEQRRIVAKVEQLMALVDQLEAQLAASRATAARLLSALVAELTTQA